MKFKFTRFDFVAMENYLNRVLVIDKLHVTHTFKRIGLTKATVFMNLTGLISFNDPKLIASAFALFLITGKKPYITRFGMFETFHYIRCDIMLSVNAIDYFTMFRIFQFIGCRALRAISKHDLDINDFSSFSSNGIFLSIANLNFLRVFETHYVFFRWYERVHFRIFTNFPNVRLMHMGFSFFKFFKNC